MREAGALAEDVGKGGGVRGRTVLVGLGGAVLTVVLLFLGNRLVHWLIWGSGYTDLPGQDTLGLVLNLEPYGIGVIALLAGRFCGVMCTSFRWLAVLFSVVPLVALTAVSPPPFWYWCVLAPSIEMLGAYPPRWSSMRRIADVRSRRESEASRRTRG
jgi:hypothetical protein